MWDGIVKDGSLYFEVEYDGAGSGPGLRMWYENRRYTGFFGGPEFAKYDVVLVYRIPQGVRDGEGSYGEKDAIDYIKGWREHIMAIAKPRSVTILRDRRRFVRAGGPRTCYYDKDYYKTL